MARLEGKVAIVTGAGGGIGKEHALLLAEQGASVVVNDIGLRRGASAESVVEEIVAAGGAAVASTASATWDGATQIVDDTLAAFGRVDILVNNATAGAVNDLWRFTEAEWDRTVGVNLKGYFAMIRAVAPHLCRQGSGVIVNTSSGSGFGHPAMIAYSSAKEGVIGLTRTVARELGRFGVRCNAIRPFATGASTADYSVTVARWMRLMNITMGAEPGVETTPDLDAAPSPARKIAPLVVWLCTDAATDVNGRTFHVSGDDVSLLSEPTAEVTIRHEGGWTLDDLDTTAPGSLIAGLRNPYTLEAFPELRVFDE